MQARETGMVRLSAVEDLVWALCEAAGAPPELVAAHLQAIQGGDADRIGLTKMALVRALPALKTSAASAGH